MNRSRGFALVSALLLLLVITLLGVSLFLGVGLEQKAAGNSMDKTRAEQLAQSAVAVAQQWLRTTPTPIPQSCSGLTTAQVDSSFRVCLLAPSINADPATTWDGLTLFDSNKFPQLNNNVGTTGVANSFAYKPGVRITYLGFATMGPGKLYEVDAYAYGGSANTVAVVQSVYYVGGSMQNPAGQSLGQ